MKTNKYADALEARPHVCKRAYKTQNEYLRELLAWYSENEELIANALSILSRVEDGEIELFTPQNGDDFGHKIELEELMGE